MSLPVPFRDRMKSLLPTEWNDLEEALHQSSFRGVRLHRVQLDEVRETDDIVNLLAVQSPLPVPDDLRPALIHPVPWYEGAFYIPTDSLLGRHVYHEMGLYYLQEPSAMAAVTALDPQPGERILDLCAAPGGKTSAIASRMRGSGQLVANEIHPQRVVTLAQNLERLGIDAVITQEAPDTLATALPERFDAILVDAPCSGEGMFRKDETAVREWTPDSPEHCALRQRDIVRHAISMLKPGGRLVYSTCTFNPVENERIVEIMIVDHGLVLETLPLWPGWSQARSDWTSQNTDVHNARRLWPHIGQGEGHFVARLRKPESHSSGASTHKSTIERTRRRANNPVSVRSDAWVDFLHSIAAHVPNHWLSPVAHGPILYAGNDIIPKGLRTLRAGLPLAVVSGNRFEPHHHLAMSATPAMARRQFHLDDDLLLRFIQGEALSVQSEPGWTWMNHHGFPIGWGKAVPSRINNAYPKGLRKLGLLVNHSPQS